MKLAVLMSWVVLLTSCMSSAILEQWPEQIPQQSYFKQLYREDDSNQARQSELEYLVWVARFYEGWEMMPIGWQDISESVLEYSAGYRIAAVQIIARDVNDILSGELPMEHVTEDRYGQLLGVSLEP